VTILRSAAALALVLLGPACASNPSGSSEERRLMPVERVEVVEQRSLPVQYVVQVEGYLPDSCWTADGAVGLRREGRRFVIELHMVRTAPPDAVCLQRIEIVRREIPLGPLAPGEYEVVVNGSAARAFRAS
jgi:hypothetical protein